MTPAAIDHLSRYEVDAAGCWNFTGPRLPRGYGRAGSHGYAHRYFYEVHVGPIPVGLVIDHLCRNHSCVNPDHLEPVTQRENIRRGTAPTARHMASTACPNGHPYTSSGGARVCKTCRREGAYANRRRRGTSPIPDRVHGTTNGYTNYACRCDACRVAKKANA